VSVLHQRPDEVLGHPRHLAAQPVLADLIQQLRDCANINDGYEFRRAEERYVPAPACLLAFTAWQSGNGALANIAITRALEANSRYTMALLLADALANGLPPSAARLPMTPEEVAASYGDSGAGEPAEGDGPARPASSSSV
jgi:hypothetical protein